MKKKDCLVMMMILFIATGCGASPKEDRRVLSLDAYEITYLPFVFNNAYKKLWVKDTEGFVMLYQNTNELMVNEVAHRDGGEPMRMVFFNGADIKFVIPASYRKQNNSFLVVQDTLQYFEHLEQFPAGDEEKIVAPELFSYAPLGECLEPQLYIRGY